MTATGVRIPRDAERPPMAGVLGSEVRPGDRIGSVTPFTVATLSPEVGNCPEPCRCSGRDVVAGLPSRIARDAVGNTKVIFSHIRYNVVRRGNR